MGSGLGDVEVSWRLRWFWALLVLSCLVLFGSTAKLWMGMSRGRAVLKLSRRPERNCSRKGLDVQDRLCIIDYKFTSRETESGREQTSFASCEGGMSQDGHGPLFEVWRWRRARLALPTVILCTKTGFVSSARQVIRRGMRRSTATTQRFVECPKHATPWLFEQFAIGPCWFQDAGLIVDCDAVPAMYLVDVYRY